MSKPPDGSPPPGAPPRSPDQGDVTRRSFVKTLGISAAAGAATTTAQTVQGEVRSEAVRNLDGRAVSIMGPEPRPATLRVNGRDMNTEIEPADTLLDALRWHLNLTGTKSVCDRGACGGCSVMVNGKLVASCMLLAHDAVGQEITTVEGIGTSDQLDPVQEAFIKHDALQCGFCTPGLIVASRALLNENPSPTTDEIRQGLSGNLCRCGTYVNVFNAVLEASGQPVPLDRVEGGSP